MNISAEVGESLVVKTNDSLEIVGRYCKVYPRIALFHVQMKIREIQRRAAEWEYARARGEHRPIPPHERFQNLSAWKRLKTQFKQLHEKKCCKCGSTEQLTVDHIKPKSRFPELALDINNLQMLCWPCNNDKSFRDETDYRPSGIKQSGKLTRK